MFLIRNYVPNWTTTPPAPTIASTAAPIASTVAFPLFQTEFNVPQVQLRITQFAHGHGTPEVVDTLTDKP